MPSRRPHPRPLGVLLGARRRALLGRLRNTSLGARLASVIIGLASTAGLIAGGVLSAGPLAEAAARAPGPGQITTPGGPYADLAFWLTALAITALSFRIMEGIYRHRDVRLMSSWPVPLRAQFSDRFLSAALESLLAWLALALFLGPVALVTGDPRAAGGLLLSAAGLWVSLTLGFAVQLYAGVTSFVRRDRSGNALSDLGRLDVGGGTAAAFTISPGLAMAASLALLLWLKMAALDEFFVRGTSRLFWIGLGTPAVLSTVAVFKARGWFVAHYPRLLARFYESDLIQIDTGYNYHQSVTHGRRGIFERLVPDGLLSHYRKDALQLGRRYPLLRALAVALWIVVGIMASRDAGALSAAVPLAYITALAAPWSRLYGADLEPGILGSLPASDALIHRAKLLASLREILMLVLPSAALILALGRDLEALATAALLTLGALVLTPAMVALTRHVGAASSRLGGLVIAALALGLGSTL